jgi:hypothetical protein
VPTRTGALMRASEAADDSVMVTDAPRHGRVSDEHVDELRRQVARTAKPCGCKSGAAMVLVALVGWPAWRAAAGLPDSVGGIAEALLAWAGVTVCAALAGKLAGIAVGRARHRRLVRRLRQALD